MSAPTATPSAAGAAEPRSASRSASPTGGHFPCLDAYRGVAMLLEICFHANVYSLYAGPRGFLLPVIVRVDRVFHTHIESVYSGNKGFLEPLLMRIDIVLPIFFVLSAFLLFRPYAVALLRGRNNPPAGGYLRNRFLRVFPGYWFALVCAVLFFDVRFKGPLDVAIFATTLQTYVGHRVFNPVYQPIYQAWSLATEFGFYLLLPIVAGLLAVWLRDRAPLDRWRAVVGAIGVLYCIGITWRIVVVLAAPAHNRPQFVLSTPSWLDMFGIGMLLALGSAWITVTDRRVPVLDTLGDHPGWCWAIVAVLYWAVSRFQPPAAPLQISPGEYIARYFFYEVIVFFAVIPGMFGDQNRGRIRRVLRWRPLAYLGQISFGMYLFHVGFLHLAERWTGAAPFHDNFLLILAIATPLSIAAGSISFYAVERPFMRLKSRRSATRAPAPA